MMRRSGFKKPELPAKVPAILRPLAQPPNYAVISANDPAPAVEKDNALRSEEYRRLVAALPCIRCNKPGPSQCAHANTGKGMGIKASDSDTFPLCNDCHRAFDQGALFTKEERRRIEKVWASYTQHEVKRG